MSDQVSRLYHGARARLGVGDDVAPRDGFATCTPNLDAAIWAAELAEGDDETRVYIVAATGPIENDEERPGYSPPPHPTMSWRSRHPLLVLGEVREWIHYHGTRAVFGPGDLIEPGHVANYGAMPRAANFVYFARTLDAATWGAELGAGDEPCRIYVVEPTGEVEDDPNVTNRRFRGNPTKSFRSRAPLRVVRELEGWIGHPPEAIDGIREGFARLEREWVEPDDE